MATGVGLDEPVEHFQQGGFAGAVVADETEAFATFDLEGDVLVGPEFAGAECDFGLLGAVAGPEAEDV